MISITFDSYDGTILDNLQQKHPDDLMVVKKTSLTSGAPLVEVLVVASAIATALAPILRDIFSFVNEKSKSEHSVIEVTEGFVGFRR